MIEKEGISSKIRIIGFKIVAQEPYGKKFNSSDYYEI